MYVTFYGATREVTGSYHTLTTGEDIILMDCGMFQGKRQEANAKNRQLTIDPKIISNAILSHAHIDHSGRIPMLTDQGFSGQVFCTRATAAACEYLLLDSAKIQEGDASYLNYKTARRFLEKVKKGDNPANISKAEIKEIKSILKNGDHNLRTNTILNLLRENNLEVIQPLYDIQSAENSLSQINGLPYRHPFTLGKNLDCTFYEAGHILGSAISFLQYKTGAGKKTVVYSGDLGRFDKPIIKDPNLNFAEEHRDVDLFIMESTYGDRIHEPVKDMKPMLKKVLTETFERGGSVLIPAFAYGRTQELIYFLHELYLEGAVPRRPIYIDSPLATKITSVFGEHPETYDEDTHDAFLENGINPFKFEHLKFVQNVEESMKLNRDKSSHIVLAGSGMCEGGRILHHLRHKIHDDRNTVLIVGYMGKNTFGRLIQEKGSEYDANGRSGEPPIVRFYNKDYPLRARVVTLGGFSAHGDKNEMTRVLTESNLNVKRVALVHGEEEQSLGFAEHLRGLGYDVVVPYKGQSVMV